MKFQIVINRDGCIACGACYFRDQVHFEADEEMKSRVVGGTTDGASVGSFDDDKIEEARVAESVCPVSVITVTET